MLDSQQDRDGVSQNFREDLETMADGIVASSAQEKVTTNDTDNVLLDEE